MRTLVATLLGGVVGGLALGAVVGYGLEAIDELRGASDAAGATFRSLTILAVALMAAALGTFVGAAAALTYAFRDAPGRQRLVTALTVLVAGPVLVALASIGFGQIDPDLSLPPVWVVVLLPTAALLGRWLATRTRVGRGAVRGEQQHHERNREQRLSGGAYDPPA